MLQENQLNLLLLPQMATFRFRFPL